MPRIGSGVMRIGVVMQHGERRPYLWKEGWSGDAPAAVPTPGNIDAI